MHLLLIEKYIIIPTCQRHEWTHNIMHNQSLHKPHELVFSPIQSSLRLTPSTSVNPLPYLPWASMISTMLGVRSLIILYNVSVTKQHIVPLFQGTMNLLFQRWHITLDQFYPRHTNMHRLPFIKAWIIQDCFLTQSHSNVWVLQHASSPSLGQNYIKQ